MPKCFPIIRKENRLYWTEGIMGCLSIFLIIILTMLVGIKYYQLGIVEIQVISCSTSANIIININIIITTKFQKDCMRNLNGDERGSLHKLNN